MNIANIASIGTPASTAGAAPLAPTGFGALLTIGGAVPLDAQIPTLVAGAAPVVAPPPASNGLLIENALPGHMQDVMLLPMDEDVVPQPIEDLILPALSDMPASRDVQPDVATPVLPQPVIEAPTRPERIAEKPEVMPATVEPAIALPAPDAIAERALTEAVGVAALAPSRVEKPKGVRETKVEDRVEAPMLQTASIVPATMAPKIVDAVSSVPDGGEMVKAPAQQMASSVSDALKSDAGVPLEVAVRGDAAAATTGAEGASSPQRMALGGIAARGQSFGEVYGHQQAEQAGSAVTAAPGRIGREMGVEIAHHVAAGRDEMMVRLDPPEMGRVDIRLSFDRDGAVRGVIAADSPGVLDMLRKETGELTRALADAGVRSDAQSFRFDSKGRDPGQTAHQRPDENGRGSQSALTGDTHAEQPAYRLVRTSGSIDLMA